MTETKTSKTLADSVYQKIRGDIVCGELAAGEKLRLTALCEKYGTGMSPLREALARLIGDALVVVEGQRGFWVSPLSLEELRDISDMRCILEGEALQRSIQNATEEWRRKLTRSYEALTDIERRLSSNIEELAPEWETANRHFHDTLVSNCGSPWLKRMIAILYQQAERYRQLSLVMDTGVRKLHDEHEAIYDAVMAGNILKACKLSEQHVKRTTISVEATLHNRAS